MKLVQCIIRTEKLDDVVDTVAKITRGLTVCSARGHGRQKEPMAVYRGVKYQFLLCPKVMIEIVTDDNKVDDVIKAIRQTAQTGEVGDGRIFVLPVEGAYHVRTGFMD
jgi:nitrogen regulatory protein P-II 1